MHDAELKSELDACDGFVVIAPEWHGMVPAALKIFSAGAATGELSHKPAPCAVSKEKVALRDLRTADEQLQNNRLCCYLSS